jgi:hypothetical protein
MSRIQVSRCSASATVLFFGQLILKRFGAMSFDLWPYNQSQCQKLVLLTLAIVIVVQATKRS